MTVKRALAILLARSKSRMPSASPISKCCFGSNANCRGVPQRRTSTLSSAERPTGTLGCGTFGISSSSASRRASASLTSGVERLDAVGDLAHERHRGLRVLAAALGLADGLGGAVALGLELLGLGHQPPALRVHREHGRERHRGAARREGALHRRGIFSDQLDVEHRVAPPLTLPSPLRGEGGTITKKRPQLRGLCHPVRRGRRRGLL